MTAQELADFDKLQGKLNVFGDRVAVMDISEENDTGLFLPEDRRITYILGRVISTGDGRIPGGVARPMYLHVGDIVFMQANGLMIAHCGCQVDGIKILIIPQGDIIATMDSNRIHADTFHITGSWILCRVKLPEKVGEIYLPNGQTADGSTSAGRPRYYVEQAGPGVTLGLEKGQEVKLDPGRANIFQLNGVLMVYIDQMSVMATVVELGS